MASRFLPSILSLAILGEFVCLSSTAKESGESIRIVAPFSGTPYRPAQDIKVHIEAEGLEIGVEYEYKMFVTYELEESGFQAMHEIREARKSKVEFSFMLGFGRGMRHKAKLGNLDITINLLRRIGPTFSEAIASDAVTVTVQELKITQKHEATVNSEYKILHGLSDIWESDSSSYQTQIVVMVPTGMWARDRRDVIRRQWKASGVDHSEAILFFTLGLFPDVLTNPPEPWPMAAFDEIQSEIAANNDILLTSCPDYDKEYSNLDYMDLYWHALVTSSTTCKLLESLKFASSHFNYRLLARTGDDAYLNIKLLLSTMDNFPSTRLYMGRVGWPNPHTPILEASNLYGLRDWPEYVTGMGVIMSSDVVATVAKMESSGIPLRKTAPEDVIIAVWLLPFEIDRIKLSSFHNHPDSHLEHPDPNRDFCTESSLLVHYVYEKQFKDIRPSDGVMMCRQGHNIKIVETELDAENYLHFRVLGDFDWSDAAVIAHIYVDQQQRGEFKIDEGQCESESGCTVGPVHLHAGDSQLEITLKQGGRELWGTPRWISNTTDLRSCTTCTT